MMALLSFWRAVPSSYLVIVAAVVAAFAWGYTLGGAHRATQAKEAAREAAEAEYEALTAEVKRRSATAEQEHRVAIALAEDRARKDRVRATELEVTIAKLQESADAHPGCIVSADRMRLLDDAGRPR